MTTRLEAFYVSGPVTVGAESGMFDNLSITAVPEPASFGLGAAGLVVVIGSIRGRRRRSA